MIFNLQNPYRSELKIELSRSKSLFIRFLIDWFLKKGEILSVKEDDAYDIHITANALQLVKTNSSQKNSTPINVEDCGAAYRFFLALLSITEGKWFLTGTERILQRPIQPLIETLVEAGADIRSTSEGILISGKQLNAKELKIDCRLSSQFASALLLIGKKIGLEHLKTIPDIPASSPYIQMTKKVMEETDRMGDVFRFDFIEQDWSSAAFWYAVMALGNIGTLYIPNLHNRSLQGDRIVADWFSCLGIQTSFLPDGVILSKTPLPILKKPLTFNIRQHPDLAPILCCTCLLLGHETSISGVENLNYKESKRLDILIESLSPFAEIQLLNDSLLQIRPVIEIKGKKLVFKSHKDHRFVMAFALFALYNEVQIDHTECVKKSYPNFLTDLEKLKN